MKSHIEELQEKIKNLEEKVEKFGVEKFSKNPVLINFYTGFQNYVLYSFSCCIEPTDTICLGGLKYKEIVILFVTLLELSPYLLLTNFCVFM